MFLRAPPVRTVTRTASPGGSYVETPERRTQMAGRRGDMYTGKPCKETARKTETDRPYDALLRTGWTRRKGGAAGKKGR